MAAARATFCSLCAVPIGKRTWVLFLSLFALVTPAVAQEDRIVPALDTILSRMAETRAENRSRFRSYAVIRRYRIFGDKEDKMKSQVIANMTFVPPNVKNFVITESNGTRLGQRIVRGILETESKAAKNFDATDFSPANYDFRVLAEAQDTSGHRMFVLELLPKRREKNLLQGKIWIDAETYRVHRVEGQPAQASSWWVRDVQLVLHYSDVEGMWLQTATEATARVRLLGKHRMVANDVEYNISPIAITAYSTPSTRSPY